MELRQTLRPFVGPVPRAANGTPVADRLARFIDWPGNDEDCWIWRGSRLPKGYGQFGGGGRTFKVHRLVYEMLVGPIPDGLEIDHLCRNRACCNPAHLEPVTHLENLRRGERANRTYCVNGHQFTPGNTYINPANGRRACCSCRRKRSRAFTAARKAAS